MASLNLGMHSAAATGDVGLIKYALDHGQSVASVLFGIQPLHAASSGGSEAAVRLLLSYGADPNAVRSKIPKATQQLLSAASTASPGNVSGAALATAGSSTPASAAAAVLASAAASASAVTSSSTSSSNGNANSAALGSVGGAGAGLGAEGSTPLHFAAANGHLPILEILLEHGAVTDALDKDGNTPEALAAGNHHDDCVGLLRDWSAGAAARGTSSLPGGLSALGGSESASGSKSTFKVFSRPRKDSVSSGMAHGGSGHVHASSSSSAGSGSVILRTQKSIDQISAAAAGMRQSLFNRKSSSNMSTSSGAAPNDVPPVPSLRQYSMDAQRLAEPPSMHPPRSVSPALSNTSDTTSGSANGDLGFASAKTPPAPTQTAPTNKRRPSLPSIFEKAAHPAQSLRNVLLGHTNSEMGSTRSGSRADLIEELSSDFPANGDSPRHARMTGKRGGPQMGRKTSVPGEHGRFDSSHSLQNLALPSTPRNQTDSSGKPFSAPYTQTAFVLPKLPSLSSTNMVSARTRTESDSSSAVQDGPSLYVEPELAVESRPRQGSASTAPPRASQPHERALSQAEIGALLRRRALSSASADRKALLQQQSSSHVRQLSPRSTAEELRPSPLAPYLTHPDEQREFLSSHDGASPRHYRASSKPTSTPNSPYAQVVALRGRQDSVSSVSGGSIMSGPLQYQNDVLAEMVGRSSPRYSPRSRNLPTPTDDAGSAGSEPRQGRSGSTSGSVSHKASNASVRSLPISAAEQAQMIIRNAEQMREDGPKLSLTEQLAAYGEALALERRTRSITEGQPTGPLRKPSSRSLASAHSHMLPSVSEDQAQSNRSVVRPIPPNSASSIASFGSSSSRPRAWSIEDEPNVLDFAPHLARSTSAMDSVSAAAARGNISRSGLRDLFLGESRMNTDWSGLTLTHILRRAWSWRQWDCAATDRPKELARLDYDGDAGPI